MDVMEEEDSVEVMGVDVDMDVEDVEGKCRRFFFSWSREECMQYEHRKECRWDLLRPRGKTWALKTNALL